MDYSLLFDYRYEGKKPERIKLIVAINSHVAVGRSHVAGFSSNWSTVSEWRSVASKLMYAAEFHVTVHIVGLLHCISFLSLYRAKRFKLDHEKLRRWTVTNKNAVALVCAHARRRYDSGDGKREI